MGTCFGQLDGCLLPTTDAVPAWGNATTNVDDLLYGINNWDPGN